ncbi:GNAT family N-acetyltransferase [Ottowia sp.]|uniref:GNAT family N-acetyltransferase n=1 Tax=Ottowia sp. TaxID=1898956 RepID=UPI0039E43062
MSEGSPGNHGNPLRLQIAGAPAEVHAEAWNALLARQAAPTPFMRHEYLAALHASGSAVPDAGWTPLYMLLRQGDELAAACPLYLKSHSYGEYVFDWAWANAYQEHGLAYYPKALIAVPFTPVPGSRLLARDAAARQALIEAVRDWCRDEGLSSLHLLFGDAADLDACDAAGLMRRDQVQFHWQNKPFTSFDDFLASLTQDKRKKIRQERRRVAEAGVTFRVLRGAEITPADWRFFYRCYERTYLEHGNPPYLTPAFFDAMARTLPETWVLFIAERGGAPIASSLIAASAFQTGAGGRFDAESAAWGRYWGALERVDSLHFEACYHQPIEWCIRHGVARFEGGAQGEHKMARALMPVVTHSAHWLAHPAFSDAVQDFLRREGAGMARYLDHLRERSPLRKSGTPSTPRGEI